MGTKELWVICSRQRCAEKPAVDRKLVTVIQIGKINDTDNTRIGDLHGEKW